MDLWKFGVTLISTNDSARKPLNFYFHSYVKVLLKLQSNQLFSLILPDAKRPRPVVLHSKKPHLQQSKPKLQPMTSPYSRFLSPPAHSTCSRASGSWMWATSSRACRNSTTMEGRTATSPTWPFAGRPKRDGTLEWSSGKGFRRKSVLSLNKKLSFLSYSKLNFRKLKYYE